MRRRKAMALSMATVMVASLEIGASASAQPPSKNDSEYVYSVADVEDAGTVIARAEKALGARYVDLWISNDQRSYVVGVLDLEDSEVVSLTKIIKRTAPVSFVDRQVSRTQVDRAVAQIERVATQVGSGVTSYGPDYEAGAATVEVEPSKAAALRSKLGSSVKVDAPQAKPAPSAAAEIIVTTGVTRPQAEGLASNPLPCG